MKLKLNENQLKCNEHQMSVQFDKNSMQILFNLLKWRDEGLLYRFSWKPPTVEIDFNQRSGLKMKFSHKGRFPNQGELTGSDLSVRVSQLRETSVWEQVIWVISNLINSELGISLFELKRDFKEIFNLIKWDMLS